MQPTMLVIRAIGAEFAKRTFYPVVIVGAIAAALLVGIVIWLTTISVWWWLLMFILICALCVGVGVFGVILLTIRSVTPLQNPAQKKAVKTFVDKLQLLAETASTPKFVLLFRIVKDVAAPRADGYIGTLTHATSSLKSDYAALLNLFR